MRCLDDSDPSILSCEGTMCPAHWSRERDGKLPTPRASVGENDDPAMAPITEKKTKAFTMAYMVFLVCPHPL